MFAKVKTWLITIGSALLIVLSLGAWVLVERRAKQFQERRANRAEALARAERIILENQARSAEKERALRADVDEALAGADELRRRAEKDRANALKKANKPPLSLLDWIDKRFSD